MLARPALALFIPPAILAVALALWGLASGSDHAARPVARPTESRPAEHAVPPAQAPARATDPMPDRNAPPAQLRRLAHEAAGAGRWHEAVEWHLRALPSGPASEADWGHLHLCVRRAAQLDRHRDPRQRRYVEALPPAAALNLYAEAVGRLSTHFADPAAATPARLFASGLDELDAALADRAFLAAYLPAATPEQVGRFRGRLRDDPAKPATAAAAREAAFRLFRDAKGCLPVDAPTALVLELLHGACRGLDEFTEFRPPEPAAPAPPGRPAGGCEGRLLGAAGGVGCLRITAFHPETPDDVDDALAALEGQGVRGLVLDLRGNPGGSLPAALKVAERLLGGGVLASSTGQVPEFAGRAFAGEAGAEGFEGALVVLVDGATQSAAEALALACRDRKATLVGTPTFGKGAVQSPLKLASGSLVVTVARLAGPRGEPLHRRGVAPDIAEADPAKQLELAYRLAGGLAPLDADAAAATVTPCHP